MNILFVAKFPPIQGGVSTQTYWLVRALVRAGHHVSVVTNSSEVEDSFKCTMTVADEAKCNLDNLGLGSIKVIRTPPLDADQRHIPQTNPIVSKLAGLAISEGSEMSFDGLFSFYLEPYAMAGQIAASSLRIPHVIQMAGSDFWRLRELPYLKPAYDHVIASAAAVFATKDQANKLLEDGFESTLLCRPWEMTVDLNLFHPPAREGEQAADDIPDEMMPLLEISCRETGLLVGIAGKLGPGKGILEALKVVFCLQERGVVITLALLGGYTTERFQREVEELIQKFGISERIIRLPFTAPWNVPVFLRLCDVICCLEQDFSVPKHLPIVAREAMACGRPLVMSRNVAEKLPQRHKLADGFNCVIVEDVTQTEDLSDAVEWIDALTPGARQLLGRRARAQAEDVEKHRIESAYFCEVMKYAGKRFDASLSPIEKPEVTRIDIERRSLSDRLSEIVESWLGSARSPIGSTPLVSGPKNQQVAVMDYLQELQRLVSALAVLDEERPPIVRSGPDRFAGRDLDPIRAAGRVRYLVSVPHWVQISNFDFDVREVLRGLEAGAVPQTPIGEASTLAVINLGGRNAKSLYILDHRLRRLVALCDGKTSVSDVVRKAVGGFSDFPAMSQEEVEDELTVMFNLGLIEVDGGRLNRRGRK